MVPSNRHLKRPKFYSNYSKHRSNRRFLPLFRLPASLRKSLVENLDKILDEIFRLYPRRQCRDAVNKTTLTLIHTNGPLILTHIAHTLRLLYINSTNNRYVIRDWLRYIPHVWNSSQHYTRDHITEPSTTFFTLQLTREEKIEKLTQEGIFKGYLALHSF